MTITIRPVQTDDDLEAWRRVRIAVMPGERCETAEELRRNATPTQLMLLAERDGVLAGSGFADRSDSAGIGFVAPRVLPEQRRHGVGTALMHALAAHVEAIGLTTVRAHADDPVALAFAAGHGFTETGRQVEQIRRLSSPRTPADTQTHADLRQLPDGITVVTVADRPDLWAACYERFGRESLGDFALDTPVHVTAEQWVAEWAGDPMFLAVHDGEVIGCAGYDRDADVPTRGECALTAVRRDWRHHGIAAHLKPLAERAAIADGLAELYTWTQTGNQGMRTLNEKLGYAYGTVSVTVGRTLPL